MRGQKNHSVCGLHYCTPQHETNILIKQCI